MVIAIYGLGLIGGSLGRAIVENTSHTVLGYDINSDTLKKAKKLKAYHFIIDDDNIKTADLVILALNTSVAIKVMHDVAIKLKKNATVIDCCGNKMPIVSQMEKLSKNYPINFIGVHPMAGKEHSGIKHSSTNLFKNAYIIMTPIQIPFVASIQVERLFNEIGCKKIIITNAKKHDRIIAYTSQLAHIVSSSYIKSPTSAEHLGYSAGSFKDMTRVARLNPPKWAELFLDNKDNLINEITMLEKHISEYKQALIDGDFDNLKCLLSDGVVKKEIADNLKEDNLFD